MSVGSRGAAILATSLAASVLIAVSACGGGAGKYAGSYKRDLYGEGEVQMKLASDGTVELTLPAPRWADNPNMKGKGTFKGDTLVFPADTGMSKCATDQAKYVFNREGDSLRVAGAGMDPCGGRRAALAGAWQKS